MIRFLYLLFLWHVSAFANPLDDSCPEFVHGRYPVIKTESVEFVCHSKIGIAYDYVNKVTIYVATKVSREQLIGDVRRKTNFKVDPHMSPFYAVKPNDYVGTIYDRGHMAEAELFSSDEIAMAESFYMSNVHPQVANFNRGIWKSLEIHARKLAKKYGEVYIITGTVYDHASVKIGRSVTVPEYSWKVINIPSINTTEAYLLPNTDHYDESFKRYKVTPKEIEILARIAF